MFYIIFHCRHTLEVSRNVVIRGDVSNDGMSVGVDLVGVVDLAGVPNNNAGIPNETAVIPKKTTAFLKID